MVRTLTESENGNLDWEGPKIRSQKIMKVSERAVVGRCKVRELYSLGFLVAEVAMVSDARLKAGVW